jgi:DNA-binding response OmpR family regulator
MNVLIVDDDDLTLELLGHNLRLLGCAVEAVDDPRLALSAARRSRPDLVLLDIEMPGLDGHSLLELMRAEAATRAVPVIMVTARDDAAAIERAGSLGADDYIVKPYDPALLKAKIARFRKG